jgi:hypothetical protein
MRITFFSRHLFVVSYALGGMPFTKEFWSARQARAYAGLMTTMGATGVTVLISDAKCTKCGLIHISGRCAEMTLAEKIESADFGQSRKVEE